MTRTKKRHAGTIEEDQKKQFIKRITSKTFNDEVRKTWNAENSNHQRIIADYRNPLIKKNIGFASKHGVPWTVEQSDKARQSAHQKQPPSMLDHDSMTEKMATLKLMGGTRRRRITRRRARRTHRRRN